MSPRAERWLLDVTRWTLAATTFALVACLIVGYLRFGSPFSPACGTDLVRRVALPSSAWTVEETYYACSAVDSGTVTIVARNEAANKSVVLATVSQLVDIDLVPTGSDALMVAMPDPEDGSAFKPYRLEPNCQTEGLTVEYRFISKAQQRPPTPPPSCSSGAPGLRRP